MTFISDHKIYDALPISNDVLDKGGVELLRAAIVDEELFVTARRDAFVGHAVWGLVLADIARRLASLYAADGQKTEAEVRTAIADAFAGSFRKLGAGTARYPSRRSRRGKEGTEPAKSAPRAEPQAQSRAKYPPTKAVARRKSARPKP